MKPRKPLPKVSKKRAGEARVYPKVKREFLRDHNICVRCGDYIPLRDRTLHHWAGRTNALLCWVPGFRMACLPCHDWIEHHRNDAVRLGFRAPDNLFGRPSLVFKAYDKAAHQAVLNAIDYEEDP